VSEQSKIKRSNVRKMTWIALSTLILTGLKVLFFGALAGTEQIIINFLYVLATIVFGYIGVSMSSDAFNANSERKHKE
jgi:hypothetical protein